MDALVKVLKESEAELKWFAMGDAVQIANLFAPVFQLYNAHPKNKTNQNNVKVLSGMVAKYLQNQNTDTARQMSRRLWTELHNLKG